ncbi:hypothetical protein IJH16_00255 [Candidatus Saccharibacteria bacterium]|nr:hypothetical protein [Candidatus Saccharibacteria bacterium]MBR5408461.1 hypothetical protein [Candidatus Saccharibacteria bacterium]
MFAVDLIEWWYLRGWRVVSTGLKHKLSDSLDFFSIGQLFRTLFAPYRQISANTSDEGNRLNAFFDRLISRLVGTVTRLFIIIFGGLAIILEAILGVLFIVIWPVIPFLPVVCIVLTITGVHL